MSGGNPVRIISEVTRAYQAKIGILSSDIPGARYFRIETVNSTAAQIAEISTKVIPISQKSVLIPGEYSGPVSGGYMNQPPFGAMPKTSATSSINPPNA